MGHEKIWENAPEGLYLAYGDFGASEGQICDPTPNIEDVADAYAERAEEGGRVLVLLVKKADTGLIATDATQKVEDALNTRLRKRGMDEVTAERLPLSEAFLTHIALWEDGDYGSLFEISGPNDEEAIKARVAKFISNYEKVPGNQKIVGTVILLEKGPEGWAAREILECPTPDTGPAPHGTA